MSVSFTPSSIATGSYPSISDSSPPMTIVRKTLDDFLKKNHNNQSKKFSFEDKFSTTYFAWFSEVYNAINIQKKESFESSLSTHKLGIKVNSFGEITSIRLDGLPNDRIPPDRMEWIVTAYKKCQQKPAQQFLQQDLITFKVALENASSKKIHVNVEGKKFVVWYKPNFSAINIQDYDNFQIKNQQNKLGIIIDKKGRITSIRIDNDIQSNNSLIIPEKFLVRMKACFKAALEISSSYTTKFPHNLGTAPIQIKIIRRGLKEIPEYHLKQFAEIIAQCVPQEKDPKICVTFLNNDTTPTKWTDAGGLTRDYIDDLFERILNGHSLKFQKTLSSFKMPCTKKDYHNGKSLPTLEEYEKSECQQIGTILMYCYNSTSHEHMDKTCSIGRHFDDALFSAALSLTANEINTSFKDISFETKLKMCLALANAYDNFDKHKTKSLNLLSKTDFLRDNLKEAAEIANYAGLLPVELTTNEEPDLEKIFGSAENQKKVINALTDYLFGFGVQVEEKLGVQLAPIHAIAQGMKSVCHSKQAITDSQWDSFYMKKDFRVFSTKVQGSVNRKEIADCIEMDLSEPLILEQNAEIEKKMRWLKSWIKDSKNGATEEQIRILLKFLTGSSSLPKDKTIKVKAQRLEPFVPVPIIHTCSFEMDLSPTPSGDMEGYNDHTKENFINCFLESMSGPNSYTL